jgi:4-hydroxybenzoate polyprenyltransferase
MIYNRFVRWAERGIWENLFGKLARSGRSADTQISIPCTSKRTVWAEGGKGGRQAIGSGEQDCVVMSESDNWPLVIDLDGTLIKTNSLDEIFLDLLRAGPRALWGLPIRCLIDRPTVKAFLAEKSPLDVETWPVRQDFLDYVEAQFKAGRKVVLATGADRKVAEAIAARFPFISEVISSDGACNMKGETKALRLRELFPNGFIYAGDAAADLAVWKVGSASVLVNATSGVMRKAKRVSEPRALFPRAPVTLNILRRSLRLHQWAKNLLVFAPLVLGGKGSDLSAWLSALLGFFALSFVASATYIINDLWDLPSDRRHWSKRMRPLASGDLSIRAGIVLAIVGLAIGFGLVTSAGPAALAMLGLYIAVALSYSFAWKRVAILDALVLASLFTLRLGFGIVLTEVRLSPWLLVFSMFVFMSLSMAKRHTEVLRLGERGLEGTHGRGYVGGDVPLTLGMGLASMFCGVLIMILYLIEDALPQGVYANPNYLWAMPFVLFLFLGRIWLLSQRGQLRDDPVAFALKDRVSLLLGLLMSMILAAALIKVG